jgi:membrane protease subunit HflC
MNRFVKMGFAAVFALLLVWFGFTFTVREGSVSLLSRFGRIASVNADAGLYWKLPWPIDSVYTYDSRYQYMDSGLTETLTRDKKNVILQTYVVWYVEDPVLFHTRIGGFDIAQAYLSDLLANAKNGVMGAYDLSALVSTNENDIKISSIEEEIMRMTVPLAAHNYGVGVKTIQVERLAFPTANIESVFEQMRADRQKSVSQLLSEGERDAAIIRSQADAEAAQIVAEGQTQAAAIDAETEKQSAEIYSSAYKKNPDLFTMLRKLAALESAVSRDTALIMSVDESPFDIILNERE